MIKLLDSKTLIPVVNKRGSAYTATLRSGEYYEWLPASNGFEDTIDLPFKDVQYLHTSSTTFKEGYLYIDNDEARKRLGLEREDIKANQLSKEEIEALLKGNLAQLKKLGSVTNKALLQEAVQIAKEIGIDNINKLQYLSEISGIPMDLILDKDDEGDK